MIYEFEVSQQTTSQDMIVDIIQQQQDFSYKYDCILIEK